MSATKTKKTTKTKAPRKAAKTTKKATSDGARVDRGQHRGDRRRRQEAEGQEGEGGEAQEAQRTRRRGAGVGRDRPADEHPRDDRDARGQEALDEPRRQDAARDSLFSNTQGDQREGEGRPVREDGAREVRRQAPPRRIGSLSRLQRPAFDVGAFSHGDNRSTALVA